MEDEGRHEAPRSFSLNTILAGAGVSLSAFVGIWWFATWLANVSQLTVEVSTIQKTQQDEQNTLTTLTTTLAALTQEVADDQAVHNERTP